MEQQKQLPPTIKGLFVNSHINIVRKTKGDDAVKSMEKRYGKPLLFKMFQEVPVKEEVKVLELVLEVLSDRPVPPEEKDFEAGRLHFRNFVTTPFGRMLLGILPRDFKYVMMRAPNIATHVFKNMQFSATELGPKSVKVIMGNSDYPLDHFRGLFQEWMHYWKYKGEVSSNALGEKTFEYIMQWE